jgi:uncharacterized protein YvpB
MKKPSRMFPILLFILLLTSVISFLANLFLGFFFFKQNTKIKFLQSVIELNRDQFEVAELEKKQNEETIAKLEALIEADVKSVKLPESVILNIKPYKQFYNGSCEVASLKSTMSYFGVEKTEDEIFDFIGIDPIEPTETEDTIYWGNPQKSFIGNLEPPGLVYNDPIFRYLDVNGFSLSVNKSNWEVDELFNYIRMGYPAIVWTSSDFKTQPKKTLVATDGTTHIWFPHEHGLVLRGIDSQNAYIMDVWNGSLYPVSHEVFKTGFANLDNTAIVVIPDIAK